jgi:uncharacterized protein (UPF0303 family)
MPASKADMPMSDRQKLTNQGQAMAGGRFPITNSSDVKRAIAAVGRAKGGEDGRMKVRRYIMRRAKELNCMGLIPDTWKADGSTSS